MSNQQSEAKTQKSSKSGLTLFIILFLASLALSAFLFFRYVKNAAQIENQNKELALAYEALNLHADSLQVELDRVMQELQDEINKNLAQEDLKQELRDQLVTKNQELSSAYARIKRLINSTSSTQGKVSTTKTGGNPKNLANAKGQINKLVKLNYEYLAKIEKLQNDYIEEKYKSDSTQVLAANYKNKNDSLRVSNIKLREKLSQVNTLRISRLKISPIREKNGNQEIVGKARKVQRLKINFSIQPGDPTEEVTKDIVIRFIAPNGFVLTQYNDELSDTDKLYSLNESVTYDGTEKSIVYYYDQEAAYQPGIYEVEVYCDGKLIDQNDFYLN